MPDLDDHALARAVADEVGAHLLDLRRRYGPVGTDRQRSAQLRADGDRTAHELALARLVAARPGDAVLSEEGEDDPARFGADRLWIVDPLDGTWEYGHDRSDWAVHVALWSHGHLRAGAVAVPVAGVTYGTDHPHVLDAGLPQGRPVRVVVSRTRPPDRLDDLLAGLAAALGVEVVADRVGSAGAKTAEVLAGRAEAYLHDAGLSEWDAAAPAAVAAAAGCLVGHADGSPLVFNRRPPQVGDLVIAAPSVAAALFALLA